MPRPKDSAAKIYAASRAQRRSPTGGARRKPYVFKFRAPDKTYSLALSFRQSSVERTDLIQALEAILTDLKNAKD